jgi:hypothetical protein
MEKVRWPPSVNGGEKPASLCLFDVEPAVVGRAVSKKQSSIRRVEKRHRVVVRVCVIIAAVQLSEKLAIAEE